MRAKRTLPLVVLPCLNPWGLVNNRRSDRDGHDLNRLFHRTDFSPLVELKKRLEGCRFDLAMHLHEDYDAQGIYLYELKKQPPAWGHALLAKCKGAIRIDPRRRIDGRGFDAGLYLRHGSRFRVPDHPEAIHLYRSLCPHVLTFETPSEFDLKRRVQAQVLLVDECVRRLLAAARPPD